MKLNYETCLVGEKVILVPYRPEHVERYHEWMKDPALLEATGSEPLSIEEEVEMQRTWRDDETKCTFIVHAADQCHEFQKAVAENKHAPFNVQENLDAMVGDVNLFLSEIDDDDNDDEQNCCDNDKEVPSLPKPRIQAEIDIMIADRSYQGKGLGRAATCTMALYGFTELSVGKIFCKINEDNTASLNLFKSIGFVQCNYAECFKQVELELKRRPEEELIEIFHAHASSYHKVVCPLT